MRSTISSRESSPSRPNLSAAARGSQLLNSTTLSQQASEGLLSPRFNRPSPTTPQWPNSPRLGAGQKTSQRSPALSPRKTTEQVAPPTLAPSALQLRVETVSKNINSDDTDLELPPPGMRTPRANSSPALETVVESSLPSTPAIGTSRVLAQKVAAVEATRNQENPQGRILEATDGETTGGESTTPTVPRSRVSTFGSNAESESESGFASEDRFGYNNPSRDASSAGPSRVFTRRPTLVNTLQINPDTSRNMTVETETVTSMIQLGGGPGSVNPSIRPKKSSDTIRAPRKEKKKRPTTIANPNPSTKAEFFGARVAAAVHEANSSDSEETFVYESNPPDQRPTAKFHSRTPSTSSIHGTIHGGPDPRVRNFSVDQPGPSVTRNKMHKFGGKSDTASLYGGDDNNGNGNGYGTVGGPAGSSRNEYGGTRNDATSRNSNHGHRSILPDDSPFAAEPRTSPQALRNPGMSHIGSKSLTGQSTRTHIRSGRNGMNGGGVYGDGAGSKRNSRTFERERRYGTAEEGDDERVPLLHPAPRHERDRNTRNRHRRPMSASLRQLEHNELRHRGWIGRCAGCIIAVVTIILVITGTVGFMFATSKPLEDVKVLNMTDVLVSQQEIMLDLVVQAMNPNMIAVTVQSMDVNLFAKSTWVKDDKDKSPSDEDPGEGDGKPKKPTTDTPAQTEQFPLLDSIDNEISRPRAPPSGSTKHQEIAALAGLGDWLPRGGRKGVDEGTDPDPNLPDQEDKQTMLLGRIMAFDSALNFDASPLQHYPSISKGSMRLGKPWNKTEKGAIERWERVVSHPFELIMRGVLKYQTPLSGRWRTASIGASVMVNPADDNLKVPIELPVDE